MDKTVKKTVKVITWTIGSLTALLALLIFFAITSNSGESKAAEKTLTHADYENKMLAVFQKNYEGIADVTFDAETKTFSILYTDEAYSSQVIKYINGDMNNFDDAIKEFNETSSLLIEKLGSGYSIHILNPVNPSKSILVLTDGEIVYKFK
jgi:hypothetical protein